MTSSTFYIFIFSSLNQFQSLNFLSTNLLFMKVGQVDKQQIISQIRQAFGQDSKQFDNFMSRAENGIMLQQVVQELRKYMKRIKAEQKAHLFYSLVILKKYSKIQLFYSYLKRIIKREQLKKIQDSISQGKPKRVSKILTEVLGELEGKKMFKFIQNQIKQQKTIQISSIMLKQQNGIKIFRYPPLEIQSSKQKIKNVIIFGETGSGKSTFINVICNYILKVQYDDQFRYKVIIDKGNINSQTTEVRDHFIRDDKENIVYRLPGFGDTKGYTVDQQTIQQIKLKLRELQSLDLIIFTLKSSQTRLTHYQKYILLSVINLFTKKCISNILFALTFSDGGISTAIDLLRDNNQEFGGSFSHIDSSQFITINNSCMFQPINDKIRQIQWFTACVSIKKLFEKIQNNEPVSLKQSFIYFRYQQKYATVLQEICSKLKLISACEKKITQQLDQIIKINKERKQIKQSLQETLISYKQIPTNHMVLRCMNCRQKNCHLQCYQLIFNLNPKDPSCCFMIQNEKCKICQCHKVSHKREPIRVQEVYKIVYKKNPQLQKRQSQLIYKKRQLLKNFSYTRLKYQSAFQQILNKKDQMDRIRRIIEQYGLLKQELFVKGKINYIEFIMDKSTNQISQKQKLKYQLQLLSNSLSCGQKIKNNLKRYKSQLIQSQKKIKEDKEVLQLHKDIFKSIEQINIIFIDAKKRQIPQVLYLFQKDQIIIQQQNGQRQNNNNNNACIQSCSSCIKCIFCCL